MHLPPLSLVSPQRYPGGKGGVSQVPSSSTAEFLRVTRKMNCRKTLIIDHVPVLSNLLDNRKCSVLRPSMGNYHCLLLSSPAFWYHRVDQTSCELEMMQQRLRKGNKEELKKERRKPRSDGENERKREK